MTPVASVKDSISPKESTTTSKPIESGYDQRIWPKAPQLEEVGQQARRLAAEAIQKAEKLESSKAG